MNHTRIEKIKWVEMGLNLGQVMLLNDDFRGIGKTKMIKVRAYMDNATIVCRSKRHAKTIMSENPFIKAIGYMEVRKGMSGAFYVDDVTESQYKNIEIQLLKQNILGGVIRRDPEMEPSETDTVRITPIPSESVSITINLNNRTKLEIMVKEIEEAVKYGSKQNGYNF